MDRDSNDIETGFDELHEAQREDLSIDVNDKSLWLSRMQIALALDLDVSEVKECTDDLKVEYPNLFETKETKKGEITKCSPNVTRLVKERTPPPMGWLKQSQMEDIDAKSSAVSRLLDRLSEEHEEEFHKHLGDEDDVPTQYFAPQIAERVRNALDNRPGKKFTKEARDDLQSEFEVFADEMLKGDSLEAKEFEALVGMFGAENATDLLFFYRTDYRKVPIEEVKSFLSDYLGDFISTSGRISFDNFEDHFELLANKNLREALTEVIIRDCLSNYQNTMRDDPKQDDTDVIFEYLDDLRNQQAVSESEELERVVDEVEEYYLSLFQDFDVLDELHLVKNLSEDRPFPDLNQRINIKDIVDKKRMLIADDPGLGKSASAIIAKEKMGIETAVIVAPGSVVDKRVWQNYLSDLVESDGKQVGYFHEGHVPKVLVVDNPSMLDEVEQGEYDYIILNHERLNDTYTEQLKKVGYGMLIVDEAHKLKNIADGIRSNSLVELSDHLEGKENTATVMLTATPAPNKPSDIAVVLRILYPEQFKQYDNKTLAYNLINKGDVLDLRSLLVPRMQMKSLENCVLIPPYQETVEYIELSDEEKELQEILLQDDEVDMQTKIQLIRKSLLNPATLHITPEVPSSKAVVAEEIINREFETSDKVILFANNFVDNVISGDKTVIDQMNLPDDVLVRYIYGDVKQSDRFAIQQEFQKSDEKILLVVNGQVADVGVDYSAADAQIHYNEGWTLSEKRQQIGRSHRPGRKKPLKVITLIANNSIELGIHDYIQKKDRATKKLLFGIPLTELDKQLLSAAEDDKDPIKDLDVNPELAAYYFSSIQRIDRLFSRSKEKGEEAFKRTIIDTHGREYARTYRELTSRSYQANMARFSGTVISKLHTSKSNPLIVDLGSGPEMLRRHMPERLQKNVVSIDINQHHFEDPASKLAAVGSVKNIPIASNSADFVNMGLVLDVTRFAPSKRKEDPTALERLELYQEMNRVLKVGGKAVITHIYSLDYEDIDQYYELMDGMGFKVVEEYSDMIYSRDENRGRVVTLEKYKDCSSVVDELVKEVGAKSLSALKFIKTDYTVKDPKRIDRAYKLANQTIIKPEFNTHDQEVADEEEEILSDMVQLIVDYDEIKNIPVGEVIRKGFARIRKSETKYALFKGLATAKGAVFTTD